MNIWMNLPDYLGKEEGGAKRFCKDSLYTGLPFLGFQGVEVQKDQILLLDL